MNMIRYLCISAQVKMSLKVKEARIKVTDMFKTKSYESVNNTW